MWFNYIAMSKKDSNLRDNPIWKDTFKLTEYIYEVNQEIIDNDPEEKWGSASKLRYAADDALFYVAQAVGGIPEYADYDWSNAKKHLFTLQTLYLFSHKQKLFDLDPEIVMLLDELILTTAKEIEKSKKAAEEKSQKDIEKAIEKRYQLDKLRLS